jgi:hypothetical protein
MTVWYKKKSTERAYKAAGRKVAREAHDALTLVVRVEAVKNFVRCPVPYVLKVPLNVPFYPIGKKNGGEKSDDYPQGIHNELPILPSGHTAIQSSCDVIAIAPTVPSKPVSLESETHHHTLALLGRLGSHVHVTCFTDNGARMHTVATRALCLYALMRAKRRLTVGDL